MTARDVIAEAVGDGEGGPDEYWDNATANLIVERLTAAGYAIVPVEPTQAMEVAGGLKCEDLLFGGDGTGIIFTDMGHVYRTMLTTSQAEQEKRG